MLEKIREGAQGPVTKVILGAVILSFALAGIGSYLGRPAENLAAVVNGQKISAQALESAVRNERQRLQRQLGENFNRLSANPAFIEQLRSSALERLVVMTLLDQAVAESGLQVGDKQVRQAILDTPYFQQDGQFSNDLYLRAIQSMGYSASGYRELLRSDISRGQYLSSFTDSEFVLEGEVAQVQKLLAQVRDIRYWQIDLNKLAASIIPSQEQVQAYYDTHQYAYQQPEMVSVEYVELSADELAKELSVTDEEVLTYYQENSELYRTQEERRASHILFTADDAGQEAAAHVQQKLAEGEEFADLAKEYSLDTFSGENGGDLDWFTTGQNAEAFDEAVFALAGEGDLSELVETEFGLHLIQLTGVRPSSVKELAEVSEQIQSELLRNKALEIYYQKQDEVTNLAFELPDSLEQLATETGLKVHATELFSQGTAPAAVADTRVQEAIFSDQVLRDGMNSDAIELAEGQLMVVRLKEYQEARTKSLDEVKPEVAQAVQLEQARAEADQLASSMLTTLNQGETLVLEAGQPVQVKTQLEMTRNSVSVEPAIRDRAFAMAKPAEGSQFDKVSGTDFVAVIALDDVKQGESEIPEAALKQSLEQQAMERSYMELVSLLKANAEILYPVAKSDEG